MLDRIKALGYKYSTKGAISVSLAGMGGPRAQRPPSSKTACSIFPPICTRNCV